MVTVGRAFGYRFVIYSNDHGPPHVHVVGNGGEARILLGHDDVTLDEVWGIGRNDMRKLLEEARLHRADFLKAWRDVHG